MTNLRSQWCLLVGALVVIWTSCVNASSVDELLYSRERLDQLLSAWKIADGADRMVVSDELCGFLQGDPEGFFEAMASRNDTWRSWISSVEGLSLEDLGGCTRVDCLRRAMILAAREATVSGHSNELREEFIRLLERPEQDRK